MIFDGRTKEEIQLFDAIRDNYMRDEFEILRSGHIVIVVNDADKCEQLIANNFFRVCLLLFSDAVPKELLA